MSNVNIYFVPNVHSVSIPLLPVVIHVVSVFNGPVSKTYNLKQKEKIG